MRADEEDDAALLSAARPAPVEEARAWEARRQAELERRMVSVCGWEWCASSRGSARKEKKSGERARSGPTPLTFFFSGIMASANPPLTQLPDGSLAPTVSGDEQLVLARPGMVFSCEGVRTASKK